MKKALLFIPILLLVGGCCNNPLLIPSVNLHNSVHRELINKYIPGDASLSAADKKIRLDALKSYGELLDALKEK
jgi:hypothetical protein